MKSFLQFRSVRIAAALAVASGFAGTIGLIATTSPVIQAGADPASSTAFVGVGADVTQDLYNAFAGEAPNPGAGVAVNFYTPISSGSATNDVEIQSWDANPQGGSTLTPGSIITKDAGPAFDRPNSSGAGTTALDASLNNTTYINSTGTSATSGAVNVGGQIDFARTAAGVNATGGDLTWLPFARDGLGILVYNDGATPATKTTITEQDLNVLYTTGGAGQGAGTDTFDGHTYIGCLPNNSASPVKNLAKAIGSTAATIEAAATNVNCNNTATQNSGNSFLTSLPSGTDYAVIPVSAGSWIGQANGVGYDRSNTARADGVDLADIVNASSTDLGQPYTVVSGKEVANDSYDSDTSWGYYISTVVPSSKIGTFGYSAPLEALFDGPSSVLCTSAQSTVTLFGFDPLPSSTCGSTTVIGTGDN
jgi:hypothetical protein